MWEWLYILEVGEIGERGVGVITENQVLGCDGIS